MQRLTPLIRPFCLLAVVITLSACAMQPMPAGAPRDTGTRDTETLRLAQATAESGDHATAARLFDKVLTSEPDSVEALLGAGDSYSRMGQNGRAETVLKRASELAPRNADVLTVLARVYLSMKQPQTAVETYDAALRVDRRNVSALTGKGVALDSLSRHYEAQKVYQDGLKLYPTNYILRSNYALSLALSGSPDQGIAILQELVRDPNAAPHVRDNLALVYGLVGRDTDARATLSLSMTPQQIEENLQVYRALRRMMLDQKPIGSLVFA